MKALAWTLLVAPLCVVACATAVRTPFGGGATGGGGDTSTTSSTTGAGAGSTGTGGSGGCVGAADCVALSDACNTGTCVNGSCTKFPANDFGACDDGQFCTENDTCQNGVCVGGTQKFCAAPDSCHIGSCDEASKSCTFVFGNDGAVCDDSDPCTSSSFCNKGTCVGGQLIDCSFLDSTCGVGTCDKQLGCVAKPQNDGTPCDDGLFCTISDHCQGGQCTGQPNPCAPPADPCQVGVCDEVTNSCTVGPGNDGAACSSGNFCKTGEACSAGKCGGGVAAHEGQACDDANACTAGTKCTAGTCGSPASTITQCINNDACCPQGCQASDNDCCPTCDPATEVFYNCKCYYLDGSKGVCDPGYVLAPQQVLYTIAAQFAGKNYKHVVSQNCCILNSEPDEDFGMQDHCNANGPFSATDVTPGAVGCTDQTNFYDGQLTLCMTPP